MRYSAEQLSVSHSEVGVLVIYIVMSSSESYPFLREKTVYCTGTENAQLVCRGCHTLLMYIRGATSVKCTCCHTVNLAMEGRNLSLPLKTKI